MRSDSRDLIQDIIPAPLRSLIELFDGPLADVQFPGVDKEAMHDACERVAEKGQDTNEARRLLDEAQSKLDQELDELRQLAKRALAYAEIYAEGDAELQASVEEIRVNIAPRKATKASGPRRKKRKAADPELPLNSGSETAGDGQPDLALSEEASSVPAEEKAEPSAPAETPRPRGRRSKKKLVEAA